MRRPGTYCSVTRSKARTENGLIDVWNKHLTPGVQPSFPRMFNIVQPQRRMEEEEGWQRYQDGVVFRLHDGRREPEWQVWWKRPIIME